MSSLSKMNLFGSNKYGYQQILAALSKLDGELYRDEEIVLCGSASVLLQNFSFRETMDIDFCVLPSDTVLQLVQTKWNDQLLFDLHAPGVIGLLIDYEDRLITVNLGLRNLHVRCLSTRDWIVSKLASPKLEDVLDHPDVSLDDLLWIQNHMVEYGGVSIDRANRDLTYLIREFQGRM